MGVRCGARGEVVLGQAFTAQEQFELIGDVGGAFWVLVGGPLGGGFLYEGIDVLLSSELSDGVEVEDLVHGYGGCAAVFADDAKNFVVIVFCHGKLLVRV